MCATATVLCAQEVLGWLIKRKQGGRAVPRVDQFDLNDPECWVWTSTRLTPEELYAGQTERGGYTRMQLAEWGVPYPPPGGWVGVLMGEYDHRRPGEDARGMTLAESMGVLFRTVTPPEQRGEALEEARRRR